MRWCAATAWTTTKGLPYMHPLLLDLDAAASVISLQPETLRRRAMAGELPGSRVGGKWRFWAPALLASVAGADAAAHMVRERTPPGYEEPGVVDVAELADLLNLSPRTIAELMRAGVVPAKKAGQWRAFWPLVRDQIAAGRDLSDTPAAPPAPSTPTPSTSAPAHAEEP